MKRVAVLAFITLFAFGKFSALNSHWRGVVAEEGGDTGDDSSDDDGEDT